MNMNSRPTLEQLKILIGSVEDDAGHHILWVERSGEVHLSEVPSHLTPNGYMGMLKSRIQFRYETYEAGNGYVGTDAARDPAYLDKLFHDLQRDWDAQAYGYIDY